MLDTEEKVTIQMQGQCGRQEGQEKSAMTDVSMRCRYLKKERGSEPIGLGCGGGLKEGFPEEEAQRGY